MIRTKALLTLGFLVGAVAFASPANAQLGGLLGGSADASGSANASVNVANGFNVVADANTKIGADAATAAYANLTGVVDKVKSADAAYLADINALKGLASKIPSADLNAIYGAAGKVKKNLADLGAMLGTADATWELDQKLEADVLGPVQAKAATAAADLKAKVTEAVSAANAVKTQVDGLKGQVEAADTEFLTEYTELNGALEALIAKAKDSAPNSQAIKDQAKATATKIKALAGQKLTATQGLVGNVKNKLGSAGGNLSQKLSDTVKAAANATGGTNLGLAGDVALTGNLSTTLSALNVLDLGVLGGLTGGVNLGGVLGGLGL